MISAAAMHVTRGDPHSIMSPDSLASLAREYAPTFAPEAGGPVSLTWEVIADANFPTLGLGTEERKRQINKVLRGENTGVLVGDGVNYAFRLGLRLTIPYQKVLVPAVTIAELERRWWYPVIVESDKAESDKRKSVGAWFEEDGSRSGKAPSYAHRWVPVAKKEQDELAGEAVQLRRTLEEEYNDG